MLRKIIVVQGMIFLASMVIFFIAAVSRDISLKTEFWWLMAEAVLAGVTMIMMAIDAERTWKVNLPQ